MLICFIFGPKCIYVVSLKVKLQWYNQHHHPHKDHACVSFERIINPMLVYKRWDSCHHRILPLIRATATAHWHA